MGATGLVERYLKLGLRLGRHIEGLVDAFYGPAELQERVSFEPVRTPSELRSAARQLLADLDAGLALDARPPDSGTARRRRYLRAQVVGLETTARILSGERVGYADEVEACYGVRPRRVDEEIFVAAHRELERVVPGTGPLSERLIAWRESQAVSPDLLPRAVASLAEELRERTVRLFGLPEGEQVAFEYVTDRPWSGFNYYLGDLQSRVAINIDLPVLSISLAHLVAHEAYPGHHTEHTRKEAGLVRQHQYLEESIFLVGTPQCLLAEGLADLGLEVVIGRRPESVVAEHLRALKIPYDAEQVAVISEAGQALSAVRSNAAFRLYEDGADPGTVVDEVARFGLLPRQRAEKAVEFLLDPTWRSYVTCYVEGLPLCRSFVDSDPSRFERLITEQLLPTDLVTKRSVS